MGREEFIEYQMCWNLTRDEAAKAFETAAGKNAAEITRDQYLRAAWEFYFGMDEAQGGAADFWGSLRTRSNLTF